MTFKFNSEITDKAIKLKIGKWTKAGLKEKMEAHEFAGSMALRYRDHGNYDFILEVADAIAAKWTRHARTAFIEWFCGATGLTYQAADKDKKLDEALIHEKGCDRIANFDEAFLTWDDGVSPDEKKNEKGVNCSFWSMVKKEQAPFDVMAKIKSLVKQANDHVASGEVTPDQAKAIIDFAASMGISDLPTAPTTNRASTETVPA